MRHSLNYGLLKDVDLSDEKIKAALPKDALAELEKTCSRKSQPAAFLVKQVIETLPAKTEFSVSDMFIKLHTGQDGILVKMATLRSTLSTLSKSGKAGIEVANADAKHRLYRKK